MIHRKNGFMQDEPASPEMTDPQDRAKISGASVDVLATRHLRNHYLWLGPLLTFGGAVSYFLVFARYANLRDFPWVNLPLVLVGLIISWLGLRRAFGAHSVYRGKWLGSLGFLFSVFVGGMFCWYVFYYSYTVPPPSQVTQALQSAPDFELVDQDGRHVRLSDFRGQNVLLVFYRGFW